MKIQTLPDALKENLQPFGSFC